MGKKRQIEIALYNQTHQKTIPRDAYLLVNCASDLKSVNVTFDPFRSKYTM